MFAFVFSTRILFENFLSSKDFTFGDRLQNFPVLKDFTVEIVFEKLSGFDYDLIFGTLPSTPHGVSSLDEHFS